MPMLVMFSLYRQAGPMHRVLLQTITSRGLNETSQNITEAATANLETTKSMGLAAAT